MRRFLEWLTTKLRPPRVIYDRMGISPYLSRWYLINHPRMPDGSEPFTADGAPKPGVTPSGWGVYLHKFHRGDDDDDLHNHPWKWAFSIMLVGGYVEERRVNGDGFIAKEARKRGGVWRRIVRPFALNVIRANDFHRVDLIEKDAWSLFVAGPKIGSWGFWNRDTDEFLYWQEFIAKKRSGERMHRT